METGILPDQWAEMGEQTIVTAFDILREQKREMDKGRARNVAGG